MKLNSANQAKANQMVCDMRGIVSVETEIKIAEELVKAGWVKMPEKTDTQEMTTLNMRIQREDNLMSKNCENCIHKEVCKFIDIAIDKKIEEPFEISCKHYMDSKLVLTYPYGDNWAIRGINTQASTTMCDNCGFYDKTTKKCTIVGKPMGIVGLPCQPKIT